MCMGGKHLKEKGIGGRESKKIEEKKQEEREGVHKREEENLQLLEHI